MVLFYNIGPRGLSHHILTVNLQARSFHSYAPNFAYVLKWSNSEKSASKSIPKTVYAFYVPWNNRTSAEILAQLHQKDIKVRYAMKQAVFGDVTIEPGGLMIARGDNPKIADFENLVGEIVKKKNDFTTISTGFSKNAKDLGGENFPLMKAPKVLLLSGNGVTSTEFGAAWYYFDEILNYPATIVDQDKLRNVKLFEFNTLVLADGRYNFSESDLKRLNEWINNGGKVIAIDGALNVFEGKDGYALNPYATDEEKQAAEKAKKERELKERFLDSGNEERRMLANSIPGAIVENNLDITHPLSFGLGKKYYSLKTGDKIYSLLKGANNVAYVPKNYKSYGYIGHDFGKKLPETVSFAVESKGSGKVIYMIDNPLFRAFWENGILLFSNALFLVN